MFSIPTTISNKIANLSRQFSMFWFWLINNCQRCSQCALRCSPWHCSALLHASTRAWTSRKQTCPSLPMPNKTSNVFRLQLPLREDTKCHCFLVAFVGTEKARGGCSESAAPCSSPGHSSLIKFTLVAAWFALFIQNSQTMNLFCLKSMQPIRPVNEMHPSLIIFNLTILRQNPKLLSIVTDLFTNTEFQESVYSPQLSQVKH